MRIVVDKRMFVSLTMLFLSTLRPISAFGPIRTLSGTSKTTQTFGAIGRRKRPKFNVDTLFAKTLPKEYAHHMEFQTALAASTAESTKTKSYNFPLAGKVIDDQPPRMRFAPSPTGSLHVGGARTALYNYLVAKKGQRDFPNGNSAFLVRVEDTDLERSTKESEASVLADLKWLGLYWDEGPDMDTPYGPYRQSERASLYTDIAQQLLEEGKAYRCFCTKEELEEMRVQQEEAGQTPRYDGRWRDADPALIQEKIDNGDEFTVRFKVPPNARVVINDAVRGTVSWDAEQTLGDFILLRSSGVPVYNFCVAVDDATMGITTVVRAEEHLTNTLRQALILDALDAPRPRYAHCSLILGEDKQKLSKRHGATSCNQFRLEGFLPDAMINYLALLGWNDGTDEEIFSRDELIDAFDLERVVKSPAVFDTEKLKWVNSQHLKRMSIEEITPMVLDQLNYNSFLTTLKTSDDFALAETTTTPSYDFALAATCLVKQRMETFQDAVDNAKTVLSYNLPSSFSDLDPSSDASQMITRGHFYNLANVLLQAYKDKSLPQPDPIDLMAAFMDPKDVNAYDPTTSQKTPIVEDTQHGGGAYSYPAAYKAFMKTLSKDLKVKGQNLFHPIRYALTGEMSGQDVTKQLSLLKMVEVNDILSHTTVTPVTMEQRMQKLQGFLETIPEEYRVPESTKQDAKKDKQTGAKAAASTETPSTPSTPSPAEEYTGPPITALDIRVGRILKAYEHPDADKLYIEEIDVGEEAPRNICSGLRPYFDSPEELVGRKCLVLCNLKARKMVGVQSYGMVLCASNEDHTVVKLVSPPIDAVVGERVTVPGYDFEGEDAQPMKENPFAKKKIFEKIAPFLKTGGESGTAEFLGKPFLTSAGVCTSPIRGGSVS